MALFRRKQNTNVLPEVDQYYAGERRDRAGLAWLLALVSVAIVALVLIGAFLVGRWVYRQLNDDEVVVTDNNGSDIEVPSIDGGSEGDQNGDGGQDQSGGNGSGSSDGQDDNQDQSQNDGQDDSTIPGGSNTDESADSENGSQADEVPATGGDEELPSTGPAGTLAVFATVSTAAGAAHYVVNRKRSAK